LAAARRVGGAELPITLTDCLKLTSQQKRQARGLPLNFVVTEGAEFLSDRPL